MGRKLSSTNTSKWVSETHVWIERYALTMRIRRPPPCSCSPSDPKALEGPGTMPLNTQKFLIVVITRTSELEENTILILLYRVGLQVTIVSCSRQSHPFPLWLSLLCNFPHSHAYVVIPCFSSPSIWKSFFNC